MTKLLLRLLILLATFGTLALAKSTVFLLSHTGLQTLQANPKLYLTSIDASIGESDRGRSSFDISQDIISDIIRKSYRKLLKSPDVEKIVLIDHYAMHLSNESIKVKPVAKNFKNFQPRISDYESFKDQVEDYIKDNQDLFTQVSSAPKNLRFGNSQDETLIMAAYLNAPRGRVDVFEQTTMNDKLSYKVSPNLDVGLNVVIYRYFPKSNNFRFHKEILHQPKAIFKSDALSGIVKRGVISASDIQTQALIEFNKNLNDSINYIHDRLKSDESFGRQAPSSNQPSAFANQPQQVSNAQNMASNGISPLEDTAVFKDPSTLKKVQNTLNIPPQEETDPLKPPAPDEPSQEENIAQDTSEPQASSYVVGSVESSSFLLQDAPPLRIDSRLLISSPSNQVSHSLARVTGFDQKVQGALISGYVNENDNAQVLPYSGQSIGLYMATYSPAINLVNLPTRATLPAYAGGLSYEFNIGYLLNMPWLSEQYIGAYYDWGMSANGQNLPSMDKLGDITTNAFQKVYTPDKNLQSSNMGLSWQKRFYLPISMYLSTGFNVGKFSLNSSYTDLTKKTTAVVFGRTYVEPNLSLAYVFNESLDVELTMGYKYLLGKGVSTKHIRKHYEMNSFSKYFISVNYLF